MKKDTKETKQQKKKEEKYDPLQDYYDPFLCDIKVSKELKKEWNKDFNELDKKLGLKK